MLNPSHCLNVIYFPIPAVVAPGGVLFEPLYWTQSPVVIIAARACRQRARGKERRHATGNRRNRHHIRRFPIGIGANSSKRKKKSNFRSIFTIGPPTTSNITSSAIFTYFCILHLTYFNHFVYFVLYKKQKNKCQILKPYCLKPMKCKLENNYKH